ncbi:MAG TPA: hypothetical protein VGQ20_04690 [Acidimicrobiales bacterium]|nr:hypothetical protein [Acidimicrobiales bacterium]
MATVDEIIVLAEKLAELDEALMPKLRSFLERLIADAENEVLEEIVTAADFTMIVDPEAQAHHVVRQCDDLNEALKQLDLDDAVTRAVLLTEDASLTLVAVAHRASRIATELSRASADEEMFGSD